MKKLLSIIFCFWSLLLNAQSIDTILIAQAEALNLLKNIRIDYDSLCPTNIKKGCFCYFKRDVYGNLYYLISDDYSKLDKNLFFNDSIKNRLSLLLDNKYEAFEMNNKNVKLENHFRFNMAFVVWLTTLSGDSSLVHKMIDNYKNDIYSKKVNHLIEISLASTNIQTFRDEFINKHKYDSNKNGDELNTMLAEICRCFFNKEGLLLSADYLLSEKEYSYQLGFNGSNGIENIDCQEKIYMNFNDMWQAVKNKSFANVFNSTNWSKYSNRLWMYNWIKNNYKNAILEFDGYLLPISDFY
ncbi:MAG: hypothetical protein MJ211_15305 [Bacteroidales bacterium]|nr:hypothetical protein [Bacteroidales bacterium]